MFKNETIQLPFGNSHLNLNSNLTGNLNGQLNKNDRSLAWSDKWSAMAPQDQTLVLSFGDQSTLNRGMLERLNELDSSGNLTRKLISMYFDFSAHTFEQLCNLVQQPGAATPNDLARHLHSFKSSSANLGLDRVATILQQLEQTNFTDENFAAAVRLLGTEIENGNHALNEWLASH